MSFIDLQTLRASRAKRAREKPDSVEGTNRVIVEF